MNMKEIEKYGPDFMYFEEPDAPINNGFFEHLQNLTESMTRVRKVIDIRSNYISKEPQEIVNRMFDNNSERINNWLNRDFATDNLVDKGNLGKVSAIDWDIIKHRVSYFIRKQSKCNDVIANLSAEEKETLCRILSEDIYSYHEEYKSKRRIKMTAIIISNKEALISPEYQLEECKKLLNYNEEFKVFTTNEIEDFHSDGDFDDFEILLDSDKISKAIIYRFDVICDDYFDLLSYISRIGNYGKLLSCYEEFDSSTEGSKYIYKLFQLFSNQVIKYNLDEEFESIWLLIEIAINYIGTAVLRQSLFEPM